MPPSSTIPSPLEENQSTKNISTQILDTKFGKPEDIIEAHIYNKNRELLQSFSNAKNVDGIIFDYSQADVISNNSNPPGDDLNPQNTNPQPSPSQQFLFDTIEIDSERFLQEISHGNFNNFSFGEYVIKYNFLRPKLALNADLTPKEFQLKTISPSRTEIEIQSLNIDNNTIQNIVKGFITDLNSYQFFRDFIVNFGDDKISTGLNIELNKTNPNSYTVYIKLYEPLPNDINVGSNLFIAEKLTDSVAIDVSLLPPSIVTGKQKP